MKQYENVNPVKYEVQMKQYMHSILDISGNKKAVFFILGIRNVHYKRIMISMSVSKNLSQTITMNSSFFLSETKYIPMCHPIPICK